jgi:Holliday junction resolvase-like predicted endonuclease
VISLDFSICASKSAQRFERLVCRSLLYQAQLCGLSTPFTDQEQQSPCELLLDLVNRLANDPLNKWQKVVILVDEYDSPVRSAVTKEKSKVMEALAEIFRTIKALDQHIAFAYVTGIESHSFAGLYSGANNFRDCTYHAEFENLCGYTENETVKMLTFFSLPHDEDTLSRLRQEYNGYSFSIRPGSDGDISRQTIFNPYFINSFVESKGIFGDYWGHTASANLLSDSFPDYSPLDDPPPPVYLKNLTIPISLESFHSNEYLHRRLLEAGYLTIKSVKDTRVSLSFPNDQIKNFLYSDYFKTTFGNFDNPKYEEARKDLRLGKLAKFLEYSNALIAATPFKNRPVFSGENWWQSSLAFAFCNAGVICHEHMVCLVGELDLLVHYPELDLMYIIEVKLSRDLDLQPSVNEALEQIVRKKYQSIGIVQTHLAEGKKLVHVAAVGLFYVQKKKEAKSTDTVDKAPTKVEETMVENKKKENKKKKGAKSKDKVEATTAKVEATPAKVEATPAKEEETTAKVGWAMLVYHDPLTKTNISSEKISSELFL